MDKKSKILICFLILLTLTSVSYAFYKTVILQDFDVIPINNEEVEE